MDYYTQIYGFLNWFVTQKCSFVKYVSCKDVFNITLDEVFSTYKFTFPCMQHASEILSYSTLYYIRLRTRQNAHQENLKMPKHYVKKKKNSKWTKIYVTILNGVLCFYPSILYTHTKSFIYMQSLLCSVIYSMYHSTIHFISCFSFSSCNIQI